MINKATKKSDTTILILIITTCMIIFISFFANEVPASELLNDENGIKIYNDGNKIIFDNKPFIENGIVYIPLRETLNHFAITNENIAWYDGTITIVALPTKAEVYIDSDDCYINNMAVRLIGKVILKDDITYVPFDFVSVFDLLLADLGGNKYFTGLEIFHNDVNIMAEYAKPDFSTHDILFVTDNLSPDIADAYKNKIFQLYKLNSAYNQYFLYDIDNDGVMELFIGWRNMRVYTYTNTIKMLGEVYNEIYKLAGETGIYTYGGFGTGLGGTNYYEIQNAVLISMEGNINLKYTYFGDSVIYRYNDEIISENIYNNLVDNYFNESNMIAPNKQTIGNLKI